MQLINRQMLSLVLALMLDLMLDLIMVLVLALLWLVVEHGYALLGLDCVQVTAGESELWSGMV